MRWEIVALSVCRILPARNTNSGFLLFEVGNTCPFRLVYSPCGESKIRAHKEASLAMRILKTFPLSSIEASETVEPTSIAQAGTGAERKEGDDSALESADHEDLNLDGLTTV